MKRLVLLFLLVLTGCVPTSQATRPRIAVVNAPTELRLPGLADAFAAALERKVGGTFSFSPANTLRFQETHNDMSGSRAPLRTSLIARSQGATYAVMVGLQGDKTARPVALNADVLEVEVTLTGRLQATLVAPDSAEVLGSYVSPEFATRVTQTVPLELPDGVERDSPEGRKTVERQVEAVRQATLPRYSDESLKKPVRELADRVAAELVTPAR